MTYEDRCRNMNHSRPSAPVRFCPNCGELVNKDLHPNCDEQKHAKLRKERSQFCSDCGKALR